MAYKALSSPGSSTNYSSEVNAGAYASPLDVFSPTYAMKNWENNLSYDPAKSVENSANPGQRMFGLSMVAQGAGSFGQVANSYVAGMSQVAALDINRNSLLGQIGVNEKLAQLSERDLIAAETDAVERRLDESEQLQARQTVSAVANGVYGNTGTFRHIISDTVSKAVKDVNTISQNYAKQRNQLALQTELNKIQMNYQADLLKIQSDLTRKATNVNAIAGSISSVAQIWGGYAAYKG